MEATVERISAWRKPQEFYRGFQKSRVERKIREILQSEEIDGRKFNRFFKLMLNFAERTEDPSAAIIKTEGGPIITLKEISSSSNSEGDRRWITIGYGGPFQKLECGLNIIAKKRNLHLSSERMSPAGGPKAFCTEVASLANVAPTPVSK